MTVEVCKIFDLNVNKRTAKHQNHTHALDYDEKSEDIQWEHLHDDLLLSLNCTHALKVREKR